MSKKPGKRSTKSRPQPKTTKMDPASPPKRKPLRLQLFVIALVPFVGLGILVVSKFRSTDRDSVVESDDKTMTSDTAIKSDAVRTPLTAIELPTLPGLENNQFDSVVRAVAKREDPVLDGWDTERLSELADKQLKMVGKMLSDSSLIDDDHVGKIATENFSTTSIRPSDAVLDEVFADETVTVLRSSSVPLGKTTGTAGFVRALSRQAALIGSLGEKRFKFKTIRVDRDEDSFTTRSYFQISGRGNDRSAQANSIWNARWASAGQGELPKMASLSVERYEEILLSAPSGGLFSDCTESVFRNSDRFGRQLVYGIDHWTDRFDGAIARPAAGHGIAVGDVNNDGLDDVYLCQSPGLPNLLLVQNPDGTVTDRAVEAGVNWLEGTRSALLIDLDNDGDQDLVAVLGGKVVIQENDGHGNFQLKSIVDAVSSLFAINAIDYDNDRDLDLFICGYTLTSGVNLSDVFANPMPFHDATNGAPNVLLRNDGNWSFTDVTEDVGLDENTMKFSYASAWEDYDGDGDLDVYVANDFGRNNLYQNEGGTFRDVAPALDVEDIGPGMSAAWGDYNNDGRFDLYVSNMFSSAGNRITHQQQFKKDLDESEKKLFQRHARGNSLFRNTTTGFEDQSVEMAVTLGRWAWGSQFVDINNDGWQDIYVTNGFMTADNNNDL